MKYDHINGLISSQYFYIVTSLSISYDSEPLYKKFRNIILQSLIGFFTKEFQQMNVLLILLVGMSIHRVLA